MPSAAAALPESVPTAQAVTEATPHVEPYVPATADIPELINALRYARRCYDHLAGRLGVAVTDALQEHGSILASDGAGYTVTKRGAATLAGLGIDTHAGDVVRGCLDWTEQRDHIAGGLGGALMSRLLELGWLARDERTRALRLTDAGRTNLPVQLGVQLP